MKRRGKAGGKAADLRRPKAAGRKRACRRQTQVSASRCRCRPARADRAQSAGIERGLAAAGRDVGGAATHQRVAGRFESGIRGYPGKRNPSLRGQVRNALSCRRRVLPSRGNAQRSPSFRRLEAAMRGPITGPTALARVAQTKRTDSVPRYGGGSRIATKIRRSCRFVKLGRVSQPVSVPMLKDGELIGAIAVHRQEVRPFTDKHIAPADEFCRPGRHRHRECAAAQRIAPAHRRSHRIAGAADGDARRCCTSSVPRRAICEPVFQDHAGECHANLRGQVRDSVAL